MAKYLDVKNIDEVIDYLKSANIRHRIIQTSNTTKIETGNINYVGYNEYIKRIDLTLISRVKNYVKKENIEYKKRIKKINYVTKFMPEVNKTKKYFAIDITKAYWFTAYKECFISGEIFKEGLKRKYSKKARLIALGCLATKPLISEFENGTYKNVDVCDLETAPIFYKCAEVVNTLMLLLKNTLGIDFLFYWVDCVYFSDRKNIIKVQKILTNFGYLCSINEIDIIEAIKEDQIIRVKTAKGKKANYNFKK